MKQGMTEKVTLVVLLLLPWLVSVIANVLAIVLVFIRFLQMYLLISPRLARCVLRARGHEEHRHRLPEGSAGVALTGTVIVISVKLYQALMAGWGRRYIVLRRQPRRLDHGKLRQLLRRSDRSHLPDVRRQFSRQEARRGGVTWPSK